MFKMYFLVTGILFMNDITFKKSMYSRTAHDTSKNDFFRKNIAFEQNVCIGYVIVQYGYAEYSRLSVSVPS